MPKPEQNHTTASRRFETLRERIEERYRRQNAVLAGIREKAAEFVRRREEERLADRTKDRDEIIGRLRRSLAGNVKRANELRVQLGRAEQTNAYADALEENAEQTGKTKNVHRAVARVIKAPEGQAVDGEEAKTPEEELAELEKTVAEQEVELEAVRRGEVMRAECYDASSEAVLFKAEGKYTVKHYRDELKKARDAYLARDAGPAEPGSYRAKEAALYGALGAVLDSLTDFAEDRIPNLEESFDWNRREGQSYRESCEKLDRAFAAAESCMLHRETDGNPVFNALYANMVNLRSAMESVTVGNLFVPPRRIVNGVPQPRPGTHFVDNLAPSRPGDAPGTVRRLNPIAHGYVYDENKPEKERLKKEYPADAEENAKLFVDRSAEPLFPHEPCPEDCNQGMVGDCYFIAALAAVTDRDPQKIKDAMIDRGDCVTVRLYTPKLEPVYVTVDKTVPRQTVNPNTGEAMEADIFSRGPLWIQMMEKAFVLSGLHAGKLAEAEAGWREGPPRYDSVDSGVMVRAVQAITGTYLRPESAIGSEYGLGWDKKIELPGWNRKPLFVPGKTGPRYTRAERAFAENVDRTYREGAVIYAGTRSEAVGPDGKRIRADDRKADKAIHYRHAHSCHGTVTGSDGRIYVRVRNPHGIEARFYAGGVSDVLPFNNGYNLVELREFPRYFSSVRAVRFSSSYRDRQLRRESMDLDRTYGGVIRAVDAALQDTNSGFYFKYKNSDEFTALARETNQLRQDLDDGFKKPDELRRQFEKVFRAAENYERVRDEKTGRDLADDRKPRSVCRYQMAELLCLLRKKYDANVGARRVGMGDLFYEMARRRGGESQARRAAREAFEHAHPEFSPTSSPAGTVRVQAVRKGVGP